MNCAATRYETTKQERVRSIAVVNAHRAPMIETATTTAIANRIPATTTNACRVGTMTKTAKKRTKIVGAKTFFNWWGTSVASNPGVPATWLVPVVATMA